MIIIRPFQMKPSFFYILVTVGIVFLSQPLYAKEARTIVQQHLAAPYNMDALRASFESSTKNMLEVFPPLPMLPMSIFELPNQPYFPKNYLNLSEGLLKLLDQKANANFLLKAFLLDYRSSKPFENNREYLTSKNFIDKWLKKIPKTDHADWRVIKSFLKGNYNIVIHKWRRKQFTLTIRHIPEVIKKINNSLVSFNDRNYASSSEELLIAQKEHLDMMSFIKNHQHFFISFGASSEEKQAFYSLLETLEKIAREIDILFFELATTGEDYHLDFAEYLIKNYRRDAAQEILKEVEARTIKRIGKFPVDPFSFNGELIAYQKTLNKTRKFFTMQQQEFLIGEHILVIKAA